jgi:hypothetical protein
MHRYALVSGLFLALLTIGQLLRLILRWPVRIGTFDVPMWCSGVAAVIVGSLAVWAFRVAARRTSTSAV